MPSPQSKRGWSAVIAACAFAATTQCALADLTGYPPSPTPLSAEEQALVAANPALADVGARDAWTLRAALVTIESAGTSQTKSPGDLGKLDPADADTLGKNPALMDVWRSAPEAAADLLALIRAAGGKGKPK